MITMCWHGANRRSENRFTLKFVQSSFLRYYNCCCGSCFVVVVVVAAAAVAVVVVVVFVVDEI